MPYSLLEQPLDWFRTVAQARRQFDETLLRELGESMAVRQLQPVGALASGQLLWGERRWRAAKLVGLPTLLTLVCDEAISESAAKIITLTENIQREELTAFELWQAAAELLRLNPAWSKRDLAAHLKKDPSTITRILSPSDCIEEVIERFKAGDIGIKAVYEISKATTPEGQRQSLAEVLAGGVESISKGRRKPHTGKPPARVGRFKFPLATGVVVSLGGDKPLSIDDVISELTDALAELKAAKRNNDTPKSFMERCKSRNKAGGDVPPSPTNQPAIEVSLA